MRYSVTTVEVMGTLYMQLKKSLDITTGHLRYSHWFSSDPGLTFIGAGPIKDFGFG